MKAGVSSEHRAAEGGPHQAPTALMAAAHFAFRALHGLDTHAADPWTGGGGQHLFTEARRHRVAGLLGAVYAAGFQPAELRLVYGQSVFTARCVAEGERLYALLSPRLQDLAIIKGPALARQAWPDLGLRSFDDLDFRCARQGYGPLCALLQEAGYRPVIAEPRRRAQLWHYGWGIGFRHPDGYLVEANHRFFPPHYPWPGDLGLHREALFCKLDLDSLALRTPTPAFHLLLACLHAIWHGGERLSWMVDIAGLLVRYPPAFEEADRLVPSDGFPRRALHTGCAIADRLFGPNLLPRGTSAVIEKAVEQYIHQLADPGSFTPRDAAPLHRLLMNPEECAGYTLRRWVTPGDGDFQRIALPEKMRFLYWVLRPLRVLMGMRE